MPAFAEGCRWCVSTLIADGRRNGDAGHVTKNRRYEAHYDGLSQQRIADADVPPRTLPASAYGPYPIRWVRGGGRPPVWAWMVWPDRPATKIAAFATGWNDRVVIVEWDGAHGTCNTVVWRNAVTHRTPP